MLTIENLDKAAKALLLTAETSDATPLEVLNLFGDSVKIRLSVSTELDNISIDDPDIHLSVRSVNCLKRAGIWNFGSLVDQLNTGFDLHTLRNLGKKSIGEIQATIFNLGYKRLTTDEKLEFWRDVIRGNAA